MSFRSVPLEQPPIIDDKNLQEWLTRMMILINASLDSAPDFTPIGILPGKVENGMVRYFSIAILPDITSPGPWMYSEGAWLKMI